MIDYIISIVLGMALCIVLATSHVKIEKWKTRAFTALNYYQEYCQKDNSCKYIY